MKLLTLDIFQSKITDKKPIQDTTEADCSQLELTHIHPDIKQAANLHKLNLKQNQLRNDARVHLAGLKNNTKLTWLNLSENQLSTLQGFETLQDLLVLNLSHNEISKMSHHLYGNKKLKALILNHNSIARIENVTYFEALTALVLSHNHIDSLQGLQVLPQLQKLSIAHNRISSLPYYQQQAQEEEEVKKDAPLSPAAAPLSELTPKLKELRLNNNQLRSLPNTIPSSLPTTLEILDLGSNQFSHLQDLQALSNLPNLHNLNLKGNPVCLHSDYKSTLLKWVPSLRILDGERFDEKFIQRKRKRQEFLEMKKSKQELIQEKKTVRKALKNQVGSEVIADAAVTVDVKDAQKFARRKKMKTELEAMDNKSKKSKKSVEKIEESSPIVDPKPIKKEIKMKKEKVESKEAAEHKIQFKKQKTIKEKTTSRQEKEKNSQDTQQDAFFMEIPEPEPPKKKKKTASKVESDKKETVVIKPLIMKPLASQVSEKHTGVVAVVNKNLSKLKSNQTSIPFNPAELEQNETAFGSVGGWD